jgi:hypothetical protein
MIRFSGPVTDYKLVDVPDLGYSGPTDRIRAANYWSKHQI